MPEPTIMAIIGAGVSAIILKAVEHFLGRAKERIDEGAKIRSELREQIDDMREEVRELETARDKWREDFYNLRDKYVELQVQLTMALEKIKDAATAIDKKPPNNL